jgi:transposase-like protein
MAGRHFDLRRWRSVYFDRDIVAHQDRALVVTRTAAFCRVSEEGRRVPGSRGISASAEIMLKEMPFLSSPNDREEEIMQIRVQRA